LNQQRRPRPRGPDIIPANEVNVVNEEEDDENQVNLKLFRKLTKLKDFLLKNLI
jgi:hypothetical protein